MSFKAKHLDFSIQLQGGRFGDGSGNKAEIKGHRASILVSKPGGRDMGQLEAAIYGLSLSTMNQLTTLGRNRLLQTKNSIIVKAYEDGQQPSTVFAGTISLAYADMRAMPQVCFRVSAAAGLFEAVQRIEPTSIRGTADVKQVMGQLAQQMGLAFEGNDVNVKIPNLYLSGSARDQAMALADMAGIQWIIDNNTLAIWKTGEPRQGGAALISPQTGLVGYPAYTASGIEVTTIFKPEVQYGRGIEVKSDLTPACGKWNVYNLTHELETETPRGKWFSIISADTAGAFASPAR